ncbi:MAG: hypothetical protein LPK14_03755, partial [Hymenobacteraceae bacterium]|nr:hypothetical protein [Hymenobacteraceae bacterium]
MRKNILFCLLASASLLTTSCEDILDKEPIDKLSLEETFKDLDGVKTALSGAYNSLLSLDYYQRNIMVYPDLAGGN